MKSNLKPFKEKLFKESDMYRPVKDFFAGLGYAVNAEVLGIDICLQKDGVLTVIELKKGLNLKLLMQAMDRTSITSQVFVAVPKPRFPKGKDSELKRKIVKRLDLGLIYVDMTKKKIEIVHFPPAIIKNPSKKRGEQVAKELGGRSVDINEGGQTGKPIGTAYREKSVRIALALEKDGGALSPKELRERYEIAGAVAGILRNNYHGWFEKAKDGKYGLSAAGMQMIIEEGELVRRIKNL